MPELMRRHHGWTVIEMIVVMAIIAVLVSVIVVTLAGAKSMAHTARCQTNLAQLAQAAVRYASDEGTWPTAIAWRIPKVGTIQEISWDWVTETSGLGQPSQRVRAGSLWNYADRPQKLYHCPQCATSDTQNNQQTGYNYNTTFIGGEMAYAPPHFPYTYRGIRPSQCQRMSQCAMFGDAGSGGPETPLNNYMRAPTRNRPEQPHLEGGPHVIGLDLVYTGAQSFRHDNATNVAFLDGHTESLTVPFRGVYWEQAPSSIQSLLDYPSEGFLSEDDRLYNPNWLPATISSP